MKLYDYQIQTIEEMYTCENENDLVILNNETGSGKTTTMLHYLHSYPLPNEFVNNYIYDINIQLYNANNYFQQFQNGQIVEKLAFNYQTFFPAATVVMVQNNLVSQWKQEIEKLPESFQKKCIFFKGVLNIETVGKHLSNGKTIFLMVLSTAKSVEITPGRLVCDELNNIDISAVKTFILSADTNLDKVSVYSLKESISTGIVKVPVDYSINYIEQSYIASLPSSMNSLIKLNHTEDNSALTKLVENNRFFSDSLDLNIDTFIKEIESKLKACKPDTPTWKNYSNTLERLQTRKKQAHCAICYEDNIDLNKIMIMVCCQNTLCIQCVLYSIKHLQYNCPYCKSKNKLNKIEYVDNEESKKVYRLDIIKNLLDKFPDDKFVFFSFNDNIYCDLFSKLGIENYSSKTFFERKKTLDKFYNSENRGLYLNGYMHATGLNLINANHIVLLHNIQDEDVKNQMIGRVIRLGQEKQVYIHQIYFEGVDDTFIK